MKKHLILFFLIFQSAIIAKGQTTISGQVFFKQDGSTIPGANIREKGTKNESLADMEGRFSISVNKLPVTLEIFFIGAVTKEVIVEKKEVLIIKLKTDCNRDTFDHQLIEIYLNSGIINSPYGGELRLSFPAFWRATTLKSRISYQTDFADKKNFYGQMAFEHIIFKCGYDLGLKMDYQKVLWKQDTVIRLNSKLHKKV